MFELHIHAQSQTGRTKNHLTSSPALTLKATQDIVTGRALLPEWPLDSRCHLIVHQDTGGGGHGPGGWGGVEGGQDNVWIIPPPLTLLPLLLQHQCLPVPCCCDAQPQQGRTEESRLSAEPAGPKGCTCRTISPQLPFNQSRRKEPETGQQQKYLSA